MKKGIFRTIMFFAIAAILFSCTESPKTILLSGDGWIIEKPDESRGKVNNQVLKFIDSKTISFGDENNYNISWVDDDAFRISLDGNVAIFKLGDFEDNKIKMAILYENEKEPVTEEEWSNLQVNDRVLQLIKNEEIVRLPDFYVINGKNIPAKKAPPAGIYIEIERSGSSMSDQEFLLL